MNEIERVFELANSGDLPEAIRLIKSLVDTNSDLQDSHVFFAHILFLSAEWSYINKLLRPETNSFIESGFLNSIAKGRPLNKTDQPIPWFTYPCIDFLNGTVKSDWTVFEFGSGNSTLWWSSKVTNVTSVEDNYNWYKEISTQMPNNVTLLHKENEEYWKSINAFPEKSFDVIIVDGSHRNQSLKSCLPHLKSNGILIFDNSDGSEFSQSSDYLKELKFYRINFFGNIPSYLYKNCTSLYFKDPSFLLDYEAPANHKSDVGVSCSQATESNK